MLTGEAIPLLVLGLGNVLCGDDGVGTAAVTLLNRRYEIPDGVQVLDGGTLGLSLLPYIEDAQQVILIDAVRSDDPAGSFVRLEGDAVAPAVANRLSPHQIGVADLLEGARLRARYPRRVVLHGLVPETLELRLGRSPAVERSLPQLVERVAAEAARLGYAFSLKANDADDDVAAYRGAGDFARIFGL